MKITVRITKPITGLELGEHYFVRILESFSKGKTYITLKEGIIIFPNQCEIKIKKKFLDLKMCDVDLNRSDFTYREFVRLKEIEYKTKKADLDNMSDKQIDDYIKLLLK